MRRRTNKRNGLKSRLLSTPLRAARSGLWHHDLGIEPLEERHLLAATVASTDPNIFSVPDLAAGTKALKVEYSLGVVNADLAGSYELLGSGGDGDFTNGNEVGFAVAATYAGSTHIASLTFATLPVDHYRFSIHAAAITDVVDHLPLDGDADGTAGGDFVKTFAIVPGQGSKLTVTGFPISTTAGTAGSISVTILDAFNNVATGYTGTLHFTSNDTQAVLPADYTFTAADNGTKVFPVTLRTVGVTRSITATDTTTTLFSNKQQGIIVTPAAASTFVVSGFASTIAGTSQNFSITANDAYGNRDINYTGTVHITSSDPQASLPADYIFTLANAGIKTLSATLRTAGSQSLTATDTAQGFSGTQTGIAISPLATTRFVTSGFPSPATAGVAGLFTVAAVDTYGNVTPSYLGTVHITSTDVAAVLPTDYAFTAADAGLKSFSATLYTIGSKTITATDTTTGSIFGSQSAISVVPGAGANISVSLLPASTSAGVAQNFRIDVRDTNGNLVPSYAGTVHFTSSDPQAVLPSDYNMTAADGGNRTFAVTLKTAGTQSVTATATNAARAVITGSGSTSVIAIAAKTLSVSGFATPSVAGTPGTITVTARDVYGNQAPSYTGTITFSSTDPAAVLPANYTFQPSDQGSATFSATLLTSGSRTITATDTSDATILGKQQGIAVTPSTAITVVVSGFPATNAGASHNFVVTAYDAFGNKDSNYTGTIHIASTDPLATLPADYTFTAVDLGNKTLSATLRTAGSQSLTATDTSLAFSGTQAGISVSPLAATQFVTGGFPSPTIAGVPGTFNVSAVDTYGNIASSYLGTVAFTSSDPLATLPANYAFTAADAGVKTFSATLYTLGSKSLTATDTTSGIVGSQVAISVQTLAATTFEVSLLPSSSTAGVAENFVIAARDAIGNLVSNFTGAIHFTSSDPLAVLPADYTFTTGDAGDRTFSATFKTAGAQTITATAIADAALTGSGSTSVAAAAAKSLSVTGFATPTAAGTAGTFTVTVRDAYGNLASGYADTVSFSSTDLAAVLPANYTFQPSDQGSATFSATLLTAGTQTITAADTSDGTILGKQQGIAVSPAITSTFVLSGLAATSAGTAQAFVLTAYDAFGNKNTGYTGTVHFTSSDPLATLPADYTFTAADGGDKTLSATLRTAGSQSLTATDTSLGFSGAQTGIVISPLAASRFVTSGFPSPSISGTSGEFTVTAVDTYGNTATSYLGTVHLTSTDALAVLPADYTFTAADVGVKSFSATLFSVGSKTITATDTISGILGSQSAISVTAGVASTFELALLPASMAAGVSENFKLSVRDAVGNLVPSYMGTVQFVSSDPLAVLPTDYTLTVADGGNRTFSVTFKTAGLQTITAVATADATLTGSASTTVAAAAAKTFGVSGFATPTVAGTPGTFTVSARDAYDNPTPNYTGTVIFSSTDLSATLPANYTFTPSDQGSATFSATLVSAGVRTITATDTSDSTILGKQQGIVVTAASASYMVIDAPATVNADTPFAVTVTAKDIHSNVAVGYRGTIHFVTSLDANSTLPLDYTFTAADAGTHTFSVTLQAAGSQTIDVADVANASITGHQGAIHVLAPQYRYAASSNNLYVTGPVTVTLTDIKAALPAAPLQLVNPALGIWMLKANLVMQDGAKLLLHGTSIGGDVNELRLKSNNTNELNGAGMPNNFIFVEAFYGTLDINTTKITSWNEAAGGGAGAPDTETDVYRRAFIRALSFEEDGIAYESRMDIKNSDIGFLGSHDAEAYGLTWKVRGETPELLAAGDFSIYDRVDVFGDVLNSKIHDNYFGMYTFGAYGMLIDNNKVYNNIGYGIDPHDDSDYVVISNNESYNNGWHGIIASQRCDHIQIIDNVSHDNGRHGIMVHRGSDYGLIADNISYNNGQHGIALFNSFYTEVRNNVVYNNQAGIRLSVGSGFNTIHDNQVYNNLESGIKFFQGSDLPSDGEEYVDATGRPTANVFEHNSILGNGQAIELSDADLNVFRSNTFGSYVSGATTRLSGDMVLTDAIDNLFQDNTVAANIVLSTRAESGAVVSKTHVKGLIGMAVKVDATSSVYFDDTTGKIFDVPVAGVSTTVSGSASKMSLAAAQIGKQIVQVLPRNLTATTAATRTVSVDVTQWNTAGDYKKVWTAQSSNVTQSVTYTAGDLAASKSYAILKNGALLKVAQSDATGKLSFSDVAGTLSPVAYSITASVNQFFVSGNINATAGISQAYTVQYSTASGTGAGAYRGKIHFTSDDPQAVLPSDYTFTAADAGKHTFSIQFKTSGPHTITVTSVTTPTITGTSLPILVAPAAAASLSVLGFTVPAYATVPGTFKVIVKDVYDNIATGYLGTVHFTASSAATLPANYTFTAADQGVHYFPATFTTAGTKSITVTDIAKSSITGTQSGIVISAAPVAGFVATGLTSATAGTAAPVTIRVVDANGNTVTANTTKVHFSSTDPLAVLPADYTYTNNDAGVRTFNVQFRTAGSQTLTVSLVSNPTIKKVLPPTTVAAAATSVLSVTGYPAAITAGVAGTFTVTAKDAYGNLTKGYLGTVAFTASGSATLPANFKFTAADQGVHTFTATFLTSGTMTLTAKDTATSSIQGTQSGIVVSSVPISSLAVSGSSSVSAGASATVTVRALGASGNTVTNFTGKVHFTSTDPQATLPADYTFTLTDAGVRTFSVPLKTAGTRSISVNLVSTPAIVGTLSNIAVTAAATSKFTVSGIPATVTAGAVVPVSVTARDAYNNVTPGYRGTIHFTSNDTLAVLPGNYAFTGADSGLHTFNVTLKTAGSRSVTATSTSGSVTGSQSGINVIAAQATVLSLSGFPSSVNAGSSKNFTVEMRDAYGNRATGYRGKISFASNDPLATLPVAYTFTAADAGIRTFSATLRSIGTRTITATEVGGTGLTGSQTGIRVK